MHPFNSIILKVKVKFENKLGASCFWLGQCSKYKLELCKLPSRLPILDTVTIGIAHQRKHTEKERGEEERSYCFEVL